MKTHSSAIRRSFWGLTLSFFVIGSFFALALDQDWSPIQAQEVSKAIEKSKANADLKKGTKAKGDVKKAIVSSRPVPGAGKKLDHTALAKIIDQEVETKIKSEGIKSSGRSTDEEFLRRVYLDLAGVIPTSDKVTAFLENKEVKKREKIIDELLNDPRFGKSVAEAWSGLMIPRESNNRRLDHTPLQKWLAEQFNKNTPLNTLVYDLVTSTGEQDKNGAVTYFIGNPTVDKMTDNVTKMFLGVQLQCAQCHNHPFVDWKQNEYWGMAQFFMKTRLTAQVQQAAKKGVPVGIYETNKAPAKKMALPESAKKVPAKFLQGEEPKLNENEPFRPVLAKWMTDAKNPYFAQAMVNRFWYQFFGRGLVNPVDDMHEDNASTHPELLAAMTEQFKTSGFDTKFLVRAICNSETYQRSSRTAEGSKTEDKEFYSHRIVRVLSAEQLYDSIVTVAGKNVGQVKGKDRTDINKKGPPATSRDGFINFFRIDEGADPLEYQVGIPQALRLMNSNQMNSVQSPVDQAMKAGGEPNQIIERLYLQTLSRRPSADEASHMIKHVQKSLSNPRTAYGDIIWALLNSSEFALNH